jgi:hypothetical protein
MDWLEEFWGDLLSEEPLRVVAAWVTLDPDEQESVRAHLTRMATESGWARSQRTAARVALDAILEPGDRPGEDTNLDPLE